MSRFESSTDGNKYFKTKNRFDTIREFFEYYGKNIMKEVRFYVNADRNVVRINTHKEESKLKIPKCQKFARWVLLEDLKF